MHVNANARPHGWSLPRRCIQVVERLHSHASKVGGSFACMAVVVAKCLHYDFLGDTGETLHEPLKDGPPILLIGSKAANFTYRRQLALATRRRRTPHAYELHILLLFFLVVLNAPCAHIIFLFLLVVLVPNAHMLFLVVHGLVGVHCGCLCIGGLKQVLTPCVCHRQPATGRADPMLQDPHSLTISDRNVCSVLEVRAGAVCHSICCDTSHGRAKGALGLCWRSAPSFPLPALLAAHSRALRLGLWSMISFTLAALVALLIARSRACDPWLFSSPLGALVALLALVRLAGRGGAGAA